MLPDRIGHGSCDLMIAFSQRHVWRIGPFTFVINDDGTDLLVVIIDVHHAARLSFAHRSGSGTDRRWCRRTYRPLLVAHVIIDNDIFPAGDGAAVSIHDRSCRWCRLPAASVAVTVKVLAIRQRSIRVNAPTSRCCPP